MAESKLSRPVVHKTSLQLDRTDERLQSWKELRKVVSELLVAYKEASDPYETIEELDESVEKAKALLARANIVVQNNIEQLDQAEVIQNVQSKIKTGRKTPGSKA